MYANLYACVGLCVCICECRVLARRGVVVLRSVHTCGFNTFFRPHRSEVALERGGGPPSSTLWLHPCICVFVCMYVCLHCICVYVSM